MIYSYQMDSLIAINQNTNRNRPNDMDIERNWRGEKRREREREFIEIFKGAILSRLKLQTNVENKTTRNHFTSKANIFLYFFSFFYF